MTKTFVTIGKTSTVSVASHQPVWVLVPVTSQPAVVATYSRQLHTGLKVLVRLGNAKKIVEVYRLPGLLDGREKSIGVNNAEAGNLRRYIDEIAGDPHKRAQLFLSFLSTRRLIRRPLYPIVAKLGEQSPLTNKDLTPLVNAVCAALRENGVIPQGYQQKLRAYIQSGTYDNATMLWLALFIDPRFAVQLWHDSLTADLPECEEHNPSREQDEFARRLHRTVEHIRTGTPCDHQVCRDDIHAWLAELVGTKPETRFFAEIGEIHQGLNKSGCLDLDRSKSFNDFGETAPRFLTLDKLSRAVTALDRALSHLTVVFADDDDDMRQLCQEHLLHSGLLIRGLLGESEAIKTLYPLHAVAIPNQPELSEKLIAKVHAAHEDGSLARICASRYGLHVDELANGIAKAISIQKQLLSIVPLEVHRLADVIETRVRLRKIAERLNSPRDRQQASMIEVACRAHAMRQQQLGKTLKADFGVDPSRLFYIDDLLIDRIKALFGNELEFLRTVLASYLERRRAATQSRSAAANPELAINS